MLVAQNNSTSNAVIAVNTGTAAPTLLARNTTTDTSGSGFMFRAEAPNVNVNGITAACQINTRGDLGCSGDVVQTRAGNGLVKALVYFDPFQSQPIVRCYNSTLPEPAAITPPCGFKGNHLGLGDNRFDFGFTVADRFVQVTAVLVANDTNNVIASIENDITGPTQIIVLTFYTTDSPSDTPFYLTVF